MSMRSLFAVLLVTACGGGPRSPTTPSTGWSCPANISTAVKREHPDAMQKACKAEHENGGDIYEATIVMLDGSTRDVELSPDGAILAVEEVIPVTALPAAVADAFTARYPEAQPERVERVTPRGRPPTYEIAWGDHEATFSEAGAFIDDEHKGDDTNETD